MQDLGCYPQQLSILNNTMSLIKIFHNLKDGNHSAFNFDENLVPCVQYLHGYQFSTVCYRSTVCTPSHHFNTLQFSSVAQSCPTICDLMNCSTPGLPVHHQIPESTQTHVHPVGDAIQPSHPLSSPSPPAPNSSQHHGLFK